MEPRKDNESACCRWGGCNGTGRYGGRCNRCGTPIPARTPIPAKKEG